MTSQVEFSYSFIFHLCLYCIAFCEIDSPRIGHAKYETVKVFFWQKVFTFSIEEQLKKF